MTPPRELDDLRYADLVAQARALIPSLCPDWTDHNPSDPGITLIELFAWLVELMAYRASRVPEQSYWAFLNLLDGTPVPGAQGPAVPLEEAIRATIASLRDVDRAVTPDDIAYLIRDKWPRSPAGLAYSTANRTPVKRVRCQPGRPLILPRALRLVDLPGSGGVLTGRNTVLGVEKEERLLVTPEPGHVSAMLLSDLAGWPERGEYEVDPDLLVELEKYLAPRRLLTTRLHVLGPRVVKIGISAKLHLHSDGAAELVRKSAEKAVWGWLHPLTGGPDKTGWPFGRRIHVSDFYQLLDGVPGLDYVEDVKLSVAGKDQPGGIDMQDFEIAAKDSERIAFEIIEPKGD